MDSIYGIDLELSTSPSFNTPSTNDINNLNHNLVNLVTNTDRPTDDHCYIFIGTN